MTSSPPVPESPALRRAHIVGRNAHRGLAVPWEAFAGAAAAAVHARLAKLELEASDEALESAFERVRGADLYLAQACELDLPDAWETLNTSYRARLSGVAVRQGVRGADAEALAGAVLSELALPPASGRTRTRMGSFGGACTLAGWLAVILTRRIAAEARRKRPASLDAAAESGIEPVQPGTTAPLDGLLSAEANQQVHAAFRRAWENLTPKERLALVAKYRDGRKQKEIAALLQVGEPRVSRLVGQALKKVGDELRDAIDGADGSWTALRDAVQQALATSIADVPPNRGGDARGGLDER